MSSMLSQLEQSLRTHGVIEADAIEVPEAADVRPWFIALLQGFAGWFAGIFLLAFVGLLFEPRAKIAILLLAAVLLFAALTIYRLDRDGVFFDQFALALSIAGQFAAAWGVMGDDFSGLAISATLLILQVAIWVVMPNKIARTLAALFATIAWVYFIRFLLWSSDESDALFGLRHDADAPAAWLPLLGWLLTWGPLLAITWWLLTRETRWMARGHSPMLRPALTGLLLGLSIAGIAAEPVSLLMLGTPQSGVPVTWTVIFPLLSIALAGFAAYGAFRVRSAGLLGLAILAALLYLARFYYFYGTTLLWKALLMTCVGVLMLVLSLWARRRAAGAA